MGPILVVSAWAEYYRGIYPGRRPHLVATFEEAIAWLSWVPRIQELCLAEVLLDRRPTLDVVEWLGRARRAGEAPRIDRVAVVNSVPLRIAQQSAALTAAGYTVRCCHAVPPRELEAGFAYALAEVLSSRIAAVLPEQGDCAQWRWLSWPV